MAKDVFIFQCPIMSVYHLRRRPPVLLPQRQPEAVVEPWVPAVEPDQLHRGANLQRTKTSWPAPNVATHALKLKPLSAQRASSNAPNVITSLLSSPKWITKPN